jgi:hypothetical protein
MASTSKQESLAKIKLQFRTNAINGVRRAINAADWIPEDDSAEFKRRLTYLYRAVLLDSDKIRNPLLLVRKDLVRCFPNRGEAFETFLIAFNEDMSFVDEQGNKTWRNDKDKLHNDALDDNMMVREAVRNKDGSREWWVDGKPYTRIKEGRRYPIKTDSQGLGTYDCGHFWVIERENGYSVKNKNLAFISEFFFDEDILKIVVIDNIPYIYTLNCGLKVFVNMD